MLEHKVGYTHSDVICFWMNMNCMCICAYKCHRPGMNTCVLLPGCLCTDRHRVVACDDLPAVTVT